MSEQRPCQCEHGSHFLNGDYGATQTPNGNPGHAFGIKYFERYLRIVKTTYGRFEVCKDCAEDCLA